MGWGELISTIEYAQAPSAWLLNRPSQVIRTDQDGKLLGVRRFYYDGGSAFGQLQKGDVTRQEDLVFTIKMLNDIFGAWQHPSLAMLG